MGFIKDSLKAVNELVTLGGASRLEMAKRAYEDAHNTSQQLIAQENAYKTQINNAISAIGTALGRAKPYLDDAEGLIKLPIQDRLHLDATIATQTLNKVEQFNAGLSSAFSVGFGSITGGTMAVGAWSLVTLFGSASTGAAISGLSGVAATNATLAWFGGGALAAGGAGMAGGMTVLGGIVAIPLVYVAAKGTHKKAKELEEAKIKVEEEIDNCRRRLETLPSTVLHFEARQHQTERLCYDIIVKISELKKVIRPLGALSFVKQKILTFFGKQPYSDAQLRAISDLTNVLAGFLSAFDAPSLFGNDG